ncbi:TetR/AcrR family transcriptional regulator [Kribbella sp. NBC_01245]|uniref:TetR/AcrR family transcriptional regulator n=1 Tax=Kribbella sp. NBC_01245 TaxID=2903578 RepID=UPI002E2D10B1|nr:TetR/AcrR family transcriptional regulator [Kribbella sp. NBC_01245]
MPRPKSGDTKQRIQAVALELFVTQGVEQTSLQQIADRLGVTKPALYYHFKSRDELVGSLFQPFLAEIETFATALEAKAPVDPRELLNSYFDELYRHRSLIQLVVQDFGVLARYDLVNRFIAWRMRVTNLLAGPDPDLREQARLMVAIGGLSDCAVMFEDADPDELRAAAVEAACATLGISPAA